MEVVVAESVRREAIDIGRLDQAAEAADLCETDIIQQDVVKLEKILALDPEVLCRTQSGS